MARPNTKNVNVYHNFCILVHKNHKGTDVAINMVTWSHCMDKLIIQEVVEPHA